MTTKTRLATALPAFLLAACGGAAAGPGGRVTIQADLAGLADQGSLVVTVDASPADVSAHLAYGADTGLFTGAMVLPAGLHTLTVQAWSDADADGEAEVVAAGSAQATVAENQTAAVLVLLVELTPPPPVPDHRPIITSAGVSNAHPLPGEAISAWVSAVDVDGDPVTYLWEAACNAGAVTIADPAAAATTISVDAAALCSISALVTANGKTTSATMAVQVGGTGQVEVTISFAPAPVVTQLFVHGQASGFVCNVRRDGDEATCADPLGMGALVDVYLVLDEASHGAETSLDACGGMVTLAEAGPGTAHYVWQAPQCSGVCVLTGTTSRAGRSDSLPVAILLQ